MQVSHPALHPHLVEVPPHFPPHPDEAPALLKSQLPVEGQALGVEGGDACQYDGYAHPPGLGQEAVQDLPAYSLSRMLGSDEAGYLCRPSESGHGIVRSQKSESQYNAQPVFGHQEGIACIMASKWFGVALLSRVWTSSMLPLHW